MSDYNRNRDYSSGNRQDQYRERFDRDNQYDQQGGYGNIGQNREDYRGGYTGNSGYGDNRDMDRGYENRGGNRDMRNTSYGSVYHGNVERREQETNRAAGGRYAGKGNYQSDYNRERGYDQQNHERQGYGGGNREHEDRDYIEVNYGRGWGDRAKDEVASWFGDEDAERRRDMDEQRDNKREQRTRHSDDNRSSRNFKGKGPMGYSRSDVRILEDVCDRLTDDSYVDATDVTVKVENCEVVLSGTVHSREEKRRVEDLAERISGVRNVQNLIRVAHDSGSDRNRERNTDRTTDNRMDNDADTNTGRTR